ncbi:leucine-rich repeat domain-containing protein [Demequina zhanjiangensis]|uniref:Excalibur calcium-binding domain-containing protein n=1 Tax=Demequina zhanjiangensis TaxID=3051659 RepID=A0ABT8G4I0_9MICO|nr:leucine-rich repeat domain-containing protein [Demequina sp. SYSU T00b26]MDN4474050.1 excalibur calcium-binding domain-containing protein [Demequina sp. SYSU T00b26]
MLTRSYRSTAAAIVAAISLALAAPVANAADDDIVTFGWYTIKSCVKQTLGRNDIGEVTRAEMATLTSLTCSISSPSTASLVGLEYATSLESLLFRGSLGSSEDLLAPLSGLPSLSSIDIDRFGGSLEPLSTLPSLESLVIEKWDATSAAELHGAPSLRSLTIRSTIDSLDGIGTLTGLTSLDVQTYTYSTGPYPVPLAPLAGLDNLETFKADGPFDAADLSMFAGMHSLWRLTLYEPTLTSVAGLEDVPNLRDLLLDEVDLDDADLAHAAALPSLTRLAMVGSNTLGAPAGRITDLGPLEGNARITELYLSHNSLDDVSVIATMPALTSLYMDRNRVADLSPLPDEGIKYDVDPQVIPLGTVQACTPITLPTVTDLFGNVLPVTLVWYEGATDGQQVILPARDHGNIWLEGVNGDVGFTYTAVGDEAGCAWAETSGFSAQLTRGSTSWPYLEATFDWPTSIHPQVKIEWIDAGGTVIATGAKRLTSSPWRDMELRARVTVVTSGYEDVVLLSDPLHVRQMLTATTRLELNGPATPASCAMVDEIDRPLETRFDYQWFRDGELIPRADKPYYCPEIADIGHRIYTVGTTNSDRFETASVTSNTITVTKAQFDAPSVAKVSGTFAVGRTLTANTDPYWYSDTITYRWLRDGKVISGATGQKYTLTSADLGHEVSLRLTAARPGYQTLTTLSTPTKVLRALSTTGPTISGNHDVGATLKAKAAAWGPGTVALSYQWRRDGVAIPGATSTSYKVTSADAGHSLSVTVTGRRSGYTTQSRTSGGFTIKRMLTGVTAPTVSGSPDAGKTLTAAVEPWGPGTVAMTYQWKRDGVTITGATKKTYTLTKADAGHAITVTVKGAKSGYSTRTRTSAAITVHRLLTAKTPTIVGTPKVGAELTASTGTWGPGTVSKTVTWYVDGKAVATGRTYVVQPGDAFKSIKVKVVGTRTGYTTAYRVSTSQTVAGKTYTTCASLRKDYPGGVAKYSTTKDKVGGVAVSGIDDDTFVSAKLYDLNSARDADKDGWACEP